jgi:DNA-binding GntR family transcriptional regulator
MYNMVAATPDPWHLEAPPPESMSGLAYRHLKEAIVRGNLPPGFRLLETELSGQLSVSRSRVREALAKLEREGLVTASPFRGTWVSELTARDVEEIYAARLLIEPPSARIVSVQGASGLTAKLREDIDRMRSAVISGDVFELTDADYRFHLNIVTGTGNRRFAEMAQRLLDYIWRLTPAVYANPSMPQNLVDEHAKVLEAITSGNGRLAEKTLRLHLRGAALNTLRVLAASPSSMSQNEQTGT